MEKLPLCAKFTGIEWTRPHKFCRGYKKLSADDANDKPMTQEACATLAINDKKCAVKSGGWYIGMKNFGKPKKPEKTEDDKAAQANKDI